jgi:hypothetical protein
LIFENMKFKTGIYISFECLNLKIEKKKWKRKRETIFIGPRRAEIRPIPLFLSCARRPTLQPRCHCADR